MFLRLHLRQLLPFEMIIKGKKKKKINYTLHLSFIITLQLIIYFMNWIYKALMMQIHHN